MNLSDLESKVLRAIVDGSPENHALADQVGLLRVTKRDYTGCGFYTRFELPLSVPLIDPDKWRFEDMPKADGQHPSVPVGAGFILWIKGGLITCLEGYTYEGDWPNDEDCFVIRA